jgi:hypothetical protein
MCAWARAQAAQHGTVRMNKGETTFNCNLNGIGYGKLGHISELSQPDLTTCAKLAARMRESGIRYFQSEQPYRTDWSCPWIHNVMLVRDPLDRAISLVNKRGPNATLGTSGSNIYVAMLAGVVHDNITRAHYERAVQQLRHFTFVETTHMAEDLCALENTQGWPHATAPHINSHKSAAPHTFAKSTLDAWKARNSLDYELYGLILERLVSQRSSMDPSSSCLAPAPNLSATFTLVSVVASCSLLVNFALVVWCIKHSLCVRFASQMPLPLRSLRRSDGDHVLVPSSLPHDV